MRPVRPGNLTARSRKQLSARQPLFWAALFFSVGIVVGNYAWRPPSWWVVAGIVFIASAICIARKSTLLPRVLGLAALIAVGALSIQLRRSNASNQSLWFGDGEVLVTAH